MEAKNKEAETENKQANAQDEVFEVSSKHLKAFVDRLEKLEEEKTAISEDIKDVYGEAKAIGFDTKTLRTIVSLRKKDVEKRREENELLDLYMSAIGMPE